MNNQQVNALVFLAGAGLLSVVGYTATDPSAS